MTTPSKFESYQGQGVPTFTATGVTDVARVVDVHGNIIGWIDDNGVPQGTLASGSGVVTAVSGTTSTAASAFSNLASAPSGDVVITDGNGNVQDSGVLLSSISGGGTAHVPWRDIQDFGGIPLNSATAAQGISATTVSGSPNVTVADNFFHLYQNLTNGQGVCIWEAGAATTQSTPSAPTITSPSVQGTATLTYQIVGYDSKGGLTAASSSGTVTNAPNVFSPVPVTITSISASGGVVTVNFSGPLNNTVTAGMTLHIINVTGAGSTWNGVWNIASAPTTSQVTYAVSGASGTGTVSASSTGRLSNSQPITAISRAANGLVTVTTAENHNYQPNIGLNTTVVNIEGVTPFAFNGEFILQSASGNTFTFFTGIMSAATGTVVPGGCSCTVWEYTTIACPALSGTTVGYYIYSDSAAPGGSLNLIGRTLTGEHHFTDWGSCINAGYVAPGYVPTTPPVSAQNQMFTSTVLSGGGTLNLVLNANVPTSIPSLGATLFIDHAPNLVLAMIGGTQTIISPPRTTTTVPVYVFNSPITIPANSTLTISNKIVISETITTAANVQINAMFSTGGAGSVAFPQRNYANVTGIANPMICLGGSGGGNVDGLEFTCGSNGQVGVQVQNSFFTKISNCAFGAATNFGSAIGLVYNNSCSSAILSDVDLVFGNRFFGTGQPGQSSWGPPIGSIWLRGSDALGIPNAGQSTSNFKMTGKNSGTGRGILFDQVNTFTVSSTQWISVDMWWLQQATTPTCMFWGQEYFGIEVSNILNDTSEAACVANWVSQAFQNVKVSNLSTNEGFSSITGNAYQFLTASDAVNMAYARLALTTSASFVTTTGLVDTVALPNYDGISPVSLQPTNQSAALDVSAGNAYISLKTSGAVQITHSNTTGMTFDIIGTVVS